MRMAPHFFIDPDDLEVCGEFSVPVSALILVYMSDMLDSDDLCRVMEVCRRYRAEEDGDPNMGVLGVQLFRKMDVSGRLSLGIEICPSLMGQAAIMDGQGAQMWVQLRGAVAERGAVALLGQRARPMFG